ncbi:hypothetical protein BGX30_014825 [Mortierella sp. GBA39]|nr:hypothetical protein BGX30_014825 [Mortierella sp. GBA39]
MTDETTANTPRVILGTMTFGLEKTCTETSLVRICGVDNIAPFLTTFHAHGHIEVDTVQLYGNDDTKTFFSQLSTAHFKISTKIYPFAPGSHNKEKLPKQFRDSLAALKGKKVDILYLYALDKSAPFEETLKAIDDLFGRVRLSFGLPGNVQPYLARSATTELLSCLKHYNLICGGVLSGKINFTKDEVKDGHRYDPNTRFGNVFRQHYWTKTNLEVVQALTEVATANNFTLRWMRHHSGLIAKDGVAIGSSSVAQLDESLTELDKGPLPEEMVKAFDEAWEHVKATTIWYFSWHVSLMQLAKPMKEKKMDGNFLSLSFPHFRLPKVKSS